MADAEMATSGTEEEDASAAGPAQVVKVKRKLIEACMTCPICNKLLRDATTISECLHTFCRKCIFDKLDEDDTDCCPVCNIDLGCIPIEKLSMERSECPLIKELIFPGVKYFSKDKVNDHKRADHNMQDLRAKIFPVKKTKVGAPDSVPSITLPVKRKEISLSSLVVNTPRVATQTSLTGRRKKAVGNRSATLSGRNSTSESNKNSDENIDKLTKKSTSNGSSSKPILSRRQASSTSDILINNANKEMENSGKPLHDKTELWKPLNCLVEAANRSKSLKSSQQSSVIKEDRRYVGDGEANISSKTRVLEHPFKVQSEKDDNVQTIPVPIKSRRLKGVIQERRNLSNTAHTLADNASAQSDRRMTPLWLSTGDSSLPQISNTYLRIKDGSIPVFCIQKYLVTKLNLFSENEVEITCRDEPVKPTMSLHNVVELWLQGVSSQKLHAIIGASAKDFVLVLGYRRGRVATAQ